jgi:hypothetical protein
LQVEPVFQVELVPVRASILGRTVFKVKPVFRKKHILQIFYEGLRITDRILLLIEPVLQIHSYGRNIPVRTNNEENNVELAFKVRTVKYGKRVSLPI